MAAVGGEREEEGSGGDVVGRSAGHREVGLIVNGARYL